MGRDEGDYDATVTIRNDDPGLASRHRFGQVMAAAQASHGRALGDIWQRRGGEPQPVTTDAHLGVHQHHGIGFLRQNRAPAGIHRLRREGHLRRFGGGEFYATRDGRLIVSTPTTSFPAPGSLWAA